MGMKVADVKRLILTEIAMLDRSLNSLETMKEDEYVQKEKYAQTFARIELQQLLKTIEDRKWT